VSVEYSDEPLTEIRICMTFSLILSLGKYGLLSCHHFLCISTPWTKHRNVTALGWPKKKTHTHKLLKLLLKLWNQYSSRNPESTAWNPESKTVLDSLAWVDLSGEKHCRSSCHIFVEGKLSSSQGIIKKNLLIKWLTLITDKTMGTRKRSREQSHRSTRTRTRTFTFLLSPASGRPTDLQTKREKVLSVTCLPTIALAVFRILILSWKNSKDVNKLRYIFQRSRLAVF